MTNKMSAKEWLANYILKELRTTKSCAKMSEEVLNYLRQLILAGKSEYYLIAENPKYTQEELRILKDYCEGYNQALEEVSKLFE